MSIAEKLTEIAENEQKVYDSGVEQGKQTEYDTFWDAFQKSGSRTDYRYGFAGEGWDSESFLPKYVIRPTNGECMFAVFGKQGGNTSITAQLKQAGVSLNTSNCTNFRQMFYACRAVEIPNIDLTKATNANSLFYDALYLRKVEITVAENTLTSYSGWFGSCKALEELTVNGVLDNSLDLGASTKLTTESIRSVVDALSLTTSGLTLTLSETAVYNDSSFDWEMVISGRENWTFALV